MEYVGYNCLKIKIDRRVAFVTIDNPPVNLFDLPLIGEMDRLGRELEVDRDVRVVVFQSADPDFFIAHVDVNFIQTFPTEVPPKSALLGPMHQMLERYRTMPKATIGKVEGIARGGGSEFLLSLDMRFGAIGRAVFCQNEVSGGIIPGAGGCQRLPRLMGRSRALEMILGCCDIPAELAERYGYINRALPPEELSPFVEKLAYRIACFPAPAIALAKAAVEAAELPTALGLIEEKHLFDESVATKEARERLALGLELGLQSREGELSNIADKVAEFYAVGG